MNDWLEAARLAVCAGPWIKTPPGLWFSSTVSAQGWSSQPHRHLQLLPPPQGGALCRWSLPFAPSFAVNAAPWPWLVSAQGQGSGRPASDLATHYAKGDRPGLGDPAAAPEPLRPLQPAVLREWFLMIRRARSNVGRPSAYMRSALPVICC